MPHIKSIDHFLLFIFTFCTEIVLDTEQVSKVLQRILIYLHSVSTDVNNFHNYDTFIKLK